MERVVEESVAATRFTDIAVIVNDDDDDGFHFATAVILRTVLVRSNFDEIIKVTSKITRTIVRVFCFAS